MQTKKHSLIEASVQTTVGFFQGIATQMVLFPLYGWTPTISENVQLVLAFTVVSLVRAYVVRRCFVRWHRS